MSPLGRPRNPELDDAAVRAAIELVVEDGYPALTMERIAVRASVSRAALYRRWPNKVELVVDAIESLVKAQGTLPDTGRLRDDVVEFLQHFGPEPVRPIWRLTRRLSRPRWATPSSATGAGTRYWSGSRTASGPS